jgi:hypothetical protein
LTHEISVDAVCAPSDNVVARVIEGELVIVPLVAGIGDADDELYTLNETGRMIWDRLDGHQTLGEVAAALTREFECSPEEVETDVLGFVREMTCRGILVVLG